jgi:hypothetical protein
MDSSNNIKIPKKKGRRPKSYYLSLNNLDNCNNIITTLDSNNQDNEVKIPKKRGRKPKGGKIITSKSIYITTNAIQHIVLHLKCHLVDLNEEFKYTTNIINVKSYNFYKDDKYNYITNLSTYIDEYSCNNDNNDNNDNNNDNNDNGNDNNKFYNLQSDNICNNTTINKPNENTCNSNNIENNSFCNIINNNEPLKTDNLLKTNNLLEYSINNNNFNITDNPDFINKNNTNTNNINNTNNKVESEQYKKILYKKINILENNLHININKKSNCFWCTYDFDNLPVYIPKFITNDTYNVYGNFCSLECACGYLFSQEIDTSNKFERYYLLNNMYKNEITCDNIKPAPNPFYTLDRFNGNLSIEEYRSISKLDNSILVIDKPISKISPEIFNENNDFKAYNKSR